MKRIHANWGKFIKWSSTLDVLELRIYAEKLPKLRWNQYEFYSKSTEYTEEPTNVCTKFNKKRGKRWIFFMITKRLRWNDASLTVSQRSTRNPRWFRYKSVRKRWRFLFVPELGSRIVVRALLCEEQQIPMIKPPDISSISCGGEIRIYEGERWNPGNGVLVRISIFNIGTYESCLPFTFFYFKISLTMDFNAGLCKIRLL